MQCSTCKSTPQTDLATFVNPERAAAYNKPESPNVMQEPISPSHLYFSHAPINKFGNPRMFPHSFTKCVFKILVQSILWLRPTIPTVQISNSVVPSEILITLPQFILTNTQPTTDPNESDSRWLSTHVIYCEKKNCVPR